VVWGRTELRWTLKTDLLFVIWVQEFGASTPTCCLRTSSIRNDIGHRTLPTLLLVDPITRRSILRKLTRATYSEPSCLSQEKNVRTAIAFSRHNSPVDHC